MMYSDFFKKSVYFFLIFQFVIITKANAQFQWEQSNLPQNTGYIVDIEFVNANTGFIAYKTNSDTVKIFRTTDKGLSFIKFWSGLAAQTEFSITFKNADTGFVYLNENVLRITSSQTSLIVSHNQYSSNKHRIKLFKNGLGYYYPRRSLHSFTVGLRRC